MNAAGIETVGSAMNGAGTEPVGSAGIGGLSYEWCRD